MRTRVLVSPVSYRVQLKVAFGFNDEQGEGIEISVFFLV